MTREVEVGGRRQAIEVRRIGPRWEMTLGGRILEVSIAPVGERWSLLIGPSEGGPRDSNAETRFGRPMRSYEVVIDRRSNGERLVYVDGTAVPASIVDPRARLRRRPADAASGGPRSIASPMPGRVVKVLVKPGDLVAAHQGLVVVEAMKMENELKAPSAGRVTAVKVSDGMSVDANAVLIVME